jgi:hypothetical protein
MLPRGRAVNRCDETGPDPIKPLSFSFISVALLNYSTAWNTYVV